MYGEGATLNTMRWKFHTLRREAELLREEVDEQNSTDTGLLGGNKLDVHLQSYDSQVNPQKNGRYSKPSESSHAKSAKSPPRKRKQDSPQDISRQLQPRRKRANAISNNIKKSTKQEDTEVNAALDNLMEASGVHSASDLGLDIVDA